VSTAERILKLKAIVAKAEAELEVHKEQAKKLKEELKALGIEGNLDTAIKKMEEKLKTLKPALEKDIEELENDISSL